MVFRINTLNSAVCPSCCYCMDLIPEINTNQTIIADRTRPEPCACQQHYKIIISGCLSSRWHGLFLFFACGLLLFALEETVDNKTRRDDNIYVLICFPVCVVFAKSSTVAYTLNFSLCRPAVLIPQTMCVIEQKCAVTLLNDQMHDLSCWIIKRMGELFWVSISQNALATT